MQICDKILNITKKAPKTDIKLEKNILNINNRYKIDNQNTNHPQFFIKNVINKLLLS